MKHFRRIHGLNISLTFLAVFLAMGGMFLMNNGNTLAVALPGVNGICGTTVNRQSVTGSIDTGLLCDAGTGVQLDSTGLDGIFNRECDGSDSAVSCFAYRNIDTAGSIPQGSGFTTSGNYIIYTSSGSVTISGVSVINVTSGTWNGTIIPPTLVTGANAATGTDTGIGSGNTPIMTIEAGATGASLQASEGYFTITFTVTNGTANQVLKIYRSQDGNTRISNTPDNNCKLNSQLQCTFRTDHLSYFAVGTLNRDNMNYINQNFWNEGPTNLQIIWALYGTGGGQTAYTQNRSGRDSSQCDLTGMTVAYLTGGTNKIPTQLSGNTIYVLNSGNYISTGTIGFSGCSALIGSGAVKISVGAGITGLDTALDISGYNNVIIDNITQDGGSANSGSLVTNGIKVYLANSVTINNANITNNGSLTGAGIGGGGGGMGCGIKVETYSSYVAISNSKISNDLQEGIFIDFSHHNTLNNIQTYNNSSEGIYLLGSNYNVLNNIQGYGNGNQGFLTFNSDYNIFNNIEAYNNTTEGMKFLNSDYNKTNNVIGYNNGSYGIFFGVSTGNQYFGSLSIFGNNNNTTSYTGWTRGTGIYANIGRTAGAASTGATLSRGHLTNPHNAAMSHNDLLTRNTGYSNLRGQNTGRSSNPPITYSIGGFTPLQTQPVRRNAGMTGLEYYGLSGTNTSTGGCDRYPSYYIGSNVFALTGNMTLGSVYNTINGQMYSNTGNLTVNILSTGANYVLGASNFVPRIGTFTAGANIQTGIVITGGDGIKVVLLQLGTGTTRATHYGFNIIIDSIPPTLTGYTATLGNVISGGYYNTTGVTVTSFDTNFSGATVTYNNGAPITYTGATGLTGTFTSDGPYTISVADYAGNSTGISFIIDKTPPIFTGMADAVLMTGGGNTYQASQIALSRSDANISGVTINSLPVTSFTTYGSKTLTGDGTYTFNITDKAGNSTGMTFTLVTLLSGTANYYTGTMVYKAASGAWFTNSQAQLLFQTNKNSTTMTVTGDFSSPAQPYVTTLTANTPVQYNFTLTNGDGLKWIYTRFTGTSQEIDAFNAVYLDTTGPVVTNALPNNGLTGISGDLTFGRSSTDAGIGTSGYYYYISNTGTFATYLTSGYTTSISTIVPSYAFLNSGTYYRNVVGVDRLGNRGITGNTRSFDYIATIDSEPDSFTFTTITGADINIAYMSNIVTITGLSPNAAVPVNIDNGVLYISGIVVGSAGTVREGDTIQIELISSNEYNQTVSSTLTIGSQIKKFRVTTSQVGNGSTTLDTSTQLSIATVFNTLINLYAGNQSKENEFMILFQSMLRDQLQILSVTNGINSNQNQLNILNYLSTLVQQYLNSNNLGSSTSHQAPNGKVYTINYDNAKACYTSSTFVNPNKCFPTLNGINSYIDANNQAWNHTVDTTRSFVTYMAPSGKTYVIEKTTDGRYFSYRFISPKYFNSLTETKTYIDKNNPKGKGR